MAKRPTQNPDTGAERRNPEGKTSPEKPGKQPLSKEDRRGYPDVGEQEDVNDEMMEEEDEMEDEEEDMT